MDASQIGKRDWDNWLHGIGGETAGYLVAEFRDDLETAPGQFQRIAARRREGP